MPLLRYCHAISLIFRFLCRYAELIWRHAFSYADAACQSVAFAAYMPFLLIFAMRQYAIRYRIINAI